MSHGTQCGGGSAHPSNVQGRSTFMQAHLMCNAEVYSSGMEVVSAHPYNMQGGGACKLHMGKVVAPAAGGCPTPAKKGKKIACLQCMGHPKTTAGKSPPEQWDVPRTWEDP
ncbi:hypothetical protein B0H17DRAFT_1149673 [Mycena rosella]|uniref:Uncharacterized protein n=1 Tax=Mycena rosella TaxID=1033263 RepID=A0AAD7C0L2_MYCRO|nr:hypothetical protein B0H17DRAFT_1149673 [Mycena rosella]